MTDPARNAALWYAQDAYDPAQKGLNGRRVAGESFLRGYLKNVDSDVVQGMVNGLGAEQKFRSATEEFLGQRKLETYYLTEQSHNPAINTVYYPSPNFSGEAWRRYHMGQRSFSICGITHTTATAGVMAGMFNLRTGPVEAWDGLICTSDSVLRQVQYQFDVFDEYSTQRFGNSKPIRPQLTRIPLGIHADEFCPTAHDRASLRAELGIADDDVAFMVLSRLSAHEKFDPIPMYRALALAQGSTSANVHMILCGYFPDEISEGVFRDGAKAAMPKVKLHVVDGKNPSRRMQSFGAADVFMFPIDNIQETFGIAPIEAMAAG
ncbi:MAG: glycosyltransferase, partial [Planktomarina sp.]